MAGSCLPASIGIGAGKQFQLTTRFAGGTSATGSITTASLYTAPKLKMSSRSRIGLRAPLLLKPNSPSNWLSWRV